MTWTLFRRVFNLRSFAGYSKDRYGTQTNSGFRSAGYSHGARSGVRSTVRSTIRHDPNDPEPSDSQEQINRAYGIPLKIYQHHEVEMHSTPAETQDGRSSSSGSIPEGLTTTVRADPPGKRREEEAMSEKSASGIVKVASGV